MTNKERSLDICNRYELNSDEGIINTVKILQEKYLYDIKFHVCDMQKNGSNEIKKFLNKYNIFMIEDLINALSYTDFKNDQFLVYKYGKLLTTDDLASVAPYDDIFDALMEIEDKEEYENSSKIERTLYDLRELVSDDDILLSDDLKNELLSDLDKIKLKIENEFCFKGE